MQFSPLWMGACFPGALWSLDEVHVGDPLHGRSSEHAEFLEQWFLNGGPQQEVSVSPGDFLKIQIVGPHSRTLYQKLWRWSPVICILNSPPHDSDVCPSVTATTVENTVIFVMVALAVRVFGLRQVSQSTVKGNTENVLVFLIIIHLRLHFLHPSIPPGMRLCPGMLIMDYLPGCLR